METKKTNKANLENKRFLFFQIGIIVALGASLAALEYSEVYDIVESEPDHVYTMASYEQEMIPITQYRKAEQKPKMQKIHILDQIEIVDDLYEMPEEDLELRNEKSAPDNPFPNTPDIIEEDVGPQPFYAVEEKPEFPGGYEAMYRWINKHIKYPMICAEMGIQGTVNLKFIINKKGEVTNVEIVKGTDRNLDKEAMRVIAMMPKWKPGKQRDVPVNVSFQMPVKFYLQ